MLTGQSNEKQEAFELKKAEKLTMDFSAMDDGEAVAYMKGYYVAENESEQEKASNAQIEADYQAEMAQNQLDKEAADSATKTKFGA